LRIIEAGVEVLETSYDLRESGALAPERLRPFGLAPDVGKLQLAVDLFQLLAARRDVKDTPSGHRDALACP